MVVDMLQSNDGSLSRFNVVITHRIIDFEINRHPIGTEVNFDTLCPVLLALHVSNPCAKLEPVVSV